MKKIFVGLILLMLATLIVYLNPQANSFMFVLNKYYLFGVKMPKKYNGEWQEWDKRYNLVKRVNYKEGVLEGHCELTLENLHFTYCFKNGMPEEAQVIRFEGENKVVTWNFKSGYPEELIITRLGDSKIHSVLIKNNAFKDEPLPSDLLHFYAIGFKELKIDFDMLYYKVVGDLLKPTIINKKEIK